MLCVHLVRGLALALNHLLDRSVVLGMGHWLVINPHHYIPMAFSHMVLECNQGDGVLIYGLFIIPGLVP